MVSSIAKAVEAYRQHLSIRGFRALEAGRLE
jgi:hypothetical protein